MKTRHLVALGTILLVGAGAATLIVPNGNDRATSTRLPDTAAHAQAVPRPDPVIDTKVWALGAARVYHCPDEAAFGRVAGGELVSEFDANARGMRPAAGRSCR